MKCPKCGSENVSIQAIQTSGKMKTNKRGCLWTIGRWTLIVCTLGLWLLVGKSNGKGKMKYTNKNRAICQNCGNSWNI